METFNKDTPWVRLEQHWALTELLLSSFWPCREPQQQKRDMRQHPSQQYPLLFSFSNPFSIVHQQKPTSSCQTRSIAFIRRDLFFWKENSKWVPEVCSGTDLRRHAESMTAEDMQRLLFLQHLLQHLHNSHWLNWIWGCRRAGRFWLVLRLAEVNQARRRSCHRWGAGGGLEHWAKSLYHFIHGAMLTAPNELLMSHGVMFCL